MSRVNLRTHSTRILKSPIGFYKAAAVVTSVFFLAFMMSCNSATSPSPSSTTTTTAAPTTTTSTTTSTTSTTTTTTGATTTTTTTPTTSTTTTTTTTTTTGGNADYATQVHPIWAAEGCTDCHDSGNPLNLDGSPTTTCSAIAARDSANQNLIIIGGNRAESAIIEKPQGKVSHVGGAFSCFDGAGRACYDTVLTWLAQGAMGPAGATCGG